MRVRRMGPPWLGAVVAAVMVVLAVAGFLPGSSPRADGAPGQLSLTGRVTLAPGVDHLRYSTTSPTNVIHVARIKAGSNTIVRPVLSNNRVIADSTQPGLETTTSMCRREGALMCINGDYTSCSGCTAPLGGVVRSAEVLRTPNPNWPQLWIGSSGVKAGRLTVGGTVTASYRWKEPIVDLPGVPATEERTSSTAINLAGVNVPRPSNGIVLYTPAYATNTGQKGGFEVRASADRRASLNRPVTLGLGSSNTTGNTRILPDHFVLSASGAAASQLKALVSEARTYRSRLTSVTVLLGASSAVSQSLGGHPVILTNGKPLPPAAASDAASRVRHPRTLFGWNNARGDVWFVTIDGRQPGRSVGATYWEAASVLLQLGATDGIMLDGGGSTTFVSKQCAGGTQCVRNRPSDGSERRVTTALAVVPRR